MYVISSVERNAAESPFVRLPGELRNKIWGYVASDLLVIVHGSNHKHHLAPSSDTDRITKAAFQLPRVCRQIYADTRILLYNQSRFIFMHWHNPALDWAILTGKVKMHFLLSCAQGEAIRTVVANSLESIQLLRPLFPSITRMELWDHWKTVIKQDKAAGLELLWHKGYADVPVSSHVAWANFPTKEKMLLHAILSPKLPQNTYDPDVDGYYVEGAIRKMMQGPDWVHQENGWYFWDVERFGHLLGLYGTPTRNSYVAKLIKDLKRNFEDHCCTVWA